MNHLARLFAKTLQNRIEPMGTSVGQFPILLLLWEDDGLSQIEISHRLGIEQATVTNTLKRMERDGMIRRFSDPNDGRRSIVRVSDKGWALREGLHEIAKDTNVRAAKDINANDLEIFLNVARRMIGNLEHPSPEAAAKE